MKSEAETAEEFFKPYRPQIEERLVEALKPEAHLAVKSANLRLDELVEKLEARDRAMKLEGIQAGLERAADIVEGAGHGLHTEIRSIDPSLVLGEMERRGKDNGLS